MKYKYNIGQEVYVKRTGKNWDDEWIIKGKITHICPLFMNGIPTYTIKRASGEIFEEIVETIISLNNPNI